MKKASLFILSMILIVALCGCQNKDYKSEKGKESIINDGNNVVAVSLSSPYGESYFFELKDNVLIVQKGDGALEDFLNNEAVLSDSETKKLSESEKNKIDSILKNMGDYKESDKYIFDAWEASVKMNGSTYRFVYGNCGNEKYDLLVSVLIKYSPMDIVDRSGRKIIPSNA